MIYKEYGKTGKKVSAIGFGGMRFLKEDYENGYDKAAEVVHKAFELGVNYFDTAPYYCDDKSEEIMGHAFRTMPREQYYVSTKSMVSAEPTADDVLRRIENSLHRLGLDKIDFFHMWCILNLEQYDKIMVKGGAYEGAVRAKEEGLIDHIVFSTHCDGAEIEKIVSDGYFEGVTLGYNAANFAFRQQGIKAAYQKGLGVVTMNPLGGGLIPQNPNLYGFLKTSSDETIAQAALRFNAGHKEISVVLAGMGTIAEVEENVKAGEAFAPIEDSDIEKMSANLKEYMNHLCTGCQYCLGCPVDIEIPKFMEAYNKYLIENKPDAALNTIQYHWHMNQEDAGKCIECGACESQCTQKLPIIQRLKEIAAMEYQNK